MTVRAKPPAAIDPGLRKMALVVALGAVMTVLDTTIVNVAVNTLGREFQTSLPVIQWVLTGYTLALTMSIPLTGWAVTRFGGRTMWTVALATFIAGSMLCGLAWSVWSLIIFRVLQGFGGGMVMPVGQLMLARAAGPERMGRMMSVLTVPAMLAPVLGPVLGGLIVAQLSWRWMFYLNIPLCTVAILFAVRVLPPDGERRPGRALDLPGLLLLSPGLAALVYGLSGVDRGPARLIGAAGVAALVVGTVRALRMARRGREPLVDVRTLRHRAFSTSMTALFLYSAAIFGLLVVLPIYYQTVQGRSAVAAGLLIAPLGLGAMVTIPLAGRVTDRSGPRGVAVTGILVAMAGTLAFTRLGPDTGVAVLAGALFVVGLGHGLISPSLMAAGLRGMNRDELAPATTLANILARLGTSFGTAAFAVILQFAIRAEIPGAGGRLGDIARLRDPSALAGLTNAFAASMWWALGIAAAAVVPALLIPAKSGSPTTSKERT